MVSVSDLRAALQPVRIPAVVLLLLAAAACNRKAEQTLPLQTTAVGRRTIVAEATASGQVEPINVIEVKSKSAGQITQMTVETGSLVKPGDLLVQLDPRDVEQQLQQAQADLRAAEARLAVSQAQKKRSDDLFSQKIITAQEHETATLDLSNAEATVIRSKSAVDIAQQRVDEATVRAPVAGTVIEKPVSLGQVIASATNSASGGTILLKMADLTKVRVRALFNETDIGNVLPGQPATVTVDAYPERPFRGTVEKIEPQAIVQSSVTMFPVLVTLDNLEGLLKPGMNGEVSVLVDRRENVLAVPNDAVRTTREAVTAARLLGLDPDSVQASVQEQVRTAMGGGRGAGGGGTDGAADNGGGRSGRAGGPRTVESRGEVALAPVAMQGGGRQGGGRQGGFQLPEVSDADCKKVTDAFAKAPSAQSTLQGLRGRMQAGEIDMQQMRAISDSIYKALGIDAMVARACQTRGRQGNAGDAGGREQRGGEQVAGAASSAQRPSVPVPAAGGEFPAPSRGRNRARQALVFVSNAGVVTPRVIRAGMSDLDYTEVVSGLEEGETVVLLAAVQMQAQRDSAMARMRRGMGGGMPGVPTGGGGGRGRGF